MLDLLIAILIALGCNVTADTTKEEIDARYSAEYQRALEIADSGSYKKLDGGGVVIWEVGGD